MLDEYLGGVYTPGVMKKPLIIAISAVATAGVMGLIIAQPTSGAFDLPGLNNQVQSLDARTTNNEKDIKALQDNTNTPPAASRVIVPQPTASSTNSQQVTSTPTTNSDPTPPSAPQPAPVTDVVGNTPTSGPVTQPPQTTPCKTPVCITY